MNVPAFIKDRRLHAGLAQREAAAAIGVSRGHYANLETGEKTPQIDQARKLARIFKLSKSAEMSFVERVIVNLAGPEIQQMLGDLESEITKLQREVEDLKSKMDNR